MPENSSKIRFFKNFHRISQKIHDTVVGAKTNPLNPIIFLT